MKIVFIIGSINDSHARNRIEEFVDNGFDVDVYGYDRRGRKRFESSKFSIQSLGEIEDSSYVPRIQKYVAGVLELKKRYRHENVVYFLNCLDLAVVFRLLNKQAQFIYEEADLVHAYRKDEKFLERLDKWVIKKSLITIFTSDGFVQYHYGNNVPDNIYVIPNKLNPDIKILPNIPKREFDKDSIHLGFVGKPRFESIYNFIDVVCSTYPSCVVDVFGGPIEEDFNELKKYSNCHFHGFFKNPDDLPQIYSSIDCLITTYDYRMGNVKYAEPNKLYEAIYFDTPIIVSKDTFLAKKVKELEIGFVVDPFDQKGIVDLVNNLSKDSITKTSSSLKKINKVDTLNINDAFFGHLSSLLK